MKNYLTSYLEQLSASAKLLWAWQQKIRIFNTAAIGIVHFSSLKISFQEVEEPIPLVRMDLGRKTANQAKYEWSCKSIGK